VHLLVNFPPTVAISRLVNSRKRPVLPQAAAGVPGPGPALLAGKPPVVRILLSPAPRAAPISVLRQYIEEQNRPA
jgi:putative transposase